jgi:nucleoside-diphosphate-sugar epimerase
LRVFVAGATGAIGRPLVPQLIAAGHEVTGMTRSEERAEALRAKGAEAVVCDAHDGEATHAAVAAARPDVLVHQLTDLPQDFSPRYEYGRTGALRAVATRNLIAGAREGGAGRVVAQSISFILAPVGDWVKDETAPTMEPDQVPDDFARALLDTLTMERQVLGAQGMEGLVLRYGFFYGPGTWYARGTELEKQFEKRRFPVVGSGDGVFSFIHVEDAAAATVAAVERGASGVYHVTDDEPAPAREWIPAFADAVGAKPPRRVPVWLARLVAGKGNAASLTTMRGASNEKAKRELGWRPRYASWRQGFRGGLS